MLHISQICSDRSQKVEDVLKEDDPIAVYVAGIDKQGRVKLEWKDKPGAPTQEEIAVDHAITSTVDAEDDLPEA